MISASGKAPTCPHHLRTTHLDAAAAANLLIPGKIGSRAVAVFPSGNLLSKLVACLVMPRADPVCIAITL